MKNFIQTLTLVLFTVLCVNLNAQTFTIKGGMNFSKFLMETDADVYSEDFKLKNGFHLGATYDFHINERFTFQPGLLYSSKGYKIDRTDDIAGTSQKYQGKTTASYLEVPLNFVARFDVGSANRVALFAGPYIGFGLNGKLDLEKDFGGQTTTPLDRPIKFGSGDGDDFKSIDFGLDFGIGFEINSILIGVSYDLGLTDIAANLGNVVADLPFSAEGQRAQTRNIKVTLGYILGK